MVKLKIMLVLPNCILDYFRTLHILENLKNQGNKTIDIIRPRIMKKVPHIIILMEEKDSWS